MAKKLRLISWNVNGLRASYKKGFLDWLQQESPDILCLQEIKAMEEQLPKALKQVEGYECHFFPAERKGYSGVALYTKIKPVKIKNGFGVKRFDVEGRTVVADYDDFVLFGVYFPNGQRSDERLEYKLDFYKAFLKHVEKLRKAGRKIVFCGDVNTAHKPIDLARPKPNEKTSGFLPIEREWIDKVVKLGYHDTFRMFNQEGENYTYWDQMSRARDRNVGWRIDYFFVDDALKKNVKDARIFANVMGSDHCPIGIDLKV